MICVDWIDEGLWLDLIEMGHSGTTAGATDSTAHRSHVVATLPSLPASPRNT